jgi:hypothetical protein
MKLGIAACIVLAATTGNANPIQLVSAPNEDFVAHLHDIADLRDDEIALEIDGQRLVTPWKVRPWKTAGEPVDVALLVQGTSHWMGNDKLLLGAHGEQQLGALEALRVALDSYNFHVLPAGSTVSMAVYSDRVRVLPTSDIVGGVLGTQHDYYGHTDSELSDAIEQTARMLHRSTQSREPRHVIVVLGDGCDDASTERRRELRRWLDRSEIELHAVLYKSKSSCPGMPVKELTSNLTTVNTVDNLAATAQSILRRLDDRTYAQFDGAKLPWDGQPHQYVVIAGDVRHGPVFRTLPDRRARGASIWTWAVGSAGVLACIALLFVIRRWHRSAAAILR